MSTRSGTTVKSFTAGRPARGAVDGAGRDSCAVPAAGRIVDAAALAPPPAAFTPMPVGAGAAVALIAGRRAQPVTITPATRTAVRPTPASFNMPFSFGRDANESFATVAHDEVEPRVHLLLAAEVGLRRCDACALDLELRGDVLALRAQVADLLLEADSFGLGVLQLRLEPSCPPPGAEEAGDADQDSDQCAAEHQSIHRLPPGGQAAHMSRRLHAARTRPKEDNSVNTG